MLNRLAMNVFGLLFIFWGILWFLEPLRAWIFQPELTQMQLFLSYLHIQLGGLFLLMVGIFLFQKAGKIND